MKYYRRHLPHYQTAENAIFITLRLANFLPRNTVNALRSEFKILQKAGDEEEINRYNILKKYFQKFDQLLHVQTGGDVFLSDERIASIVQEALQYHDGKEYELYAYCIMPNHVHLIIRLRNGFSLETTLQHLKKNIAIRSNKILHRTGAFWQHESYDHLVRDEGELGRIVQYIVMNPVKAGLVMKAEDWKWSFFKNI